MDSNIMMLCACDGELYIHALVALQPHIIVKRVDSIYLDDSFFGKHILLSADICTLPVLYILYSIYLYLHLPIRNIQHIIYMSRNTYNMHTS